MKLHELKIKEDYFNAIVRGEKTFELRKNDRDYKVGDLIHFIKINGLEYFSFSRYVYQIIYILKDVPEYGLDKDYCILGIKKIGDEIIYEI